MTYEYKKEIGNPSRKIPEQKIEIKIASAKKKKPKEITVDTSFDKSKVGRKVKVSLILPSFLILVDSNNAGFRIPRTIEHQNIAVGDTLYINF